MDAEKTNIHVDDLGERRTILESSITELTNNKKQLTENAGAFFDERKKELQQDYQHKQEELNLIQKNVNFLQSN